MYVGINVMGLLYWSRMRDSEAHESHPPGRSPAGDTRAKKPNSPSPPPPSLSVAAAGTYRQAKPRRCRRWRPFLYLAQALPGGDGGQVTRLHGGFVHVEVAASGGEVPPALAASGTRGCIPATRPRGRHGAGGQRSWREDASAAGGTRSEGCHLLHTPSVPTSLDLEVGSRCHSLAGGGDGGLRLESGRNPLPT
jgi:hypothetical protein